MDSTAGIPVSLRLSYFTHLCRNVSNCTGKVVWQNGTGGAVRRLMVTASSPGKGSQSKFVESVEEAQQIAARLGVTIPPGDIETCQHQ